MFRTGVDDTDWFVSVTEGGPYAWLGGEGVAAWLRGRTDPEYPSIQVLRDDKDPLRWGLRPCSPEAPRAVALVDGHRFSKARLAKVNPSFTVPMKIMGDTLVLEIPKGKELE